MNRLEMRLLAELICGNAEHGSGAERVRAHEGKFQSFAVPSPYRSEYEIKRFLSDNDLMSSEAIEKAYFSFKSPSTSRHEITMRIIDPMCKSSDGNLSAGAEKLVLALTDPRGYTSSNLVHEAVTYVNTKVLSFYDKRVELKNGVRPVLVPLTYEPALSETLMYDLPNFESVVEDSQLVRVLEERWEEMSVCSQSGAFLAATILLTGILEGLLKDRVTAEPQKAKSATRLRNNPREIDQWSLEQLIQCSVDVGWISREREAFLDVARQMRNFVHPHLYLKQKNIVTPNKGTIRTGMAVICSAVEDLQRAAK